MPTKVSFSWAIKWSRSASVGYTVKGQGIVDAPCKEGKTLSTFSGKFSGNNSPEMIVKQIISRMWARLTRRSGHSWSQCSKEPRRAGTTSNWSHLGSGPLLKKKVWFVFRFDQWRKSRIQKSKLLEL